MHFPSHAAIAFIYDVVCCIPPIIGISASSRAPPETESLDNISQQWKERIGIAAANGTAVGNRPSPGPLRIRGPLSSALCVSLWAGCWQPSPNIEGCQRAVHGLMHGAAPVIHSRSSPLTRGACQPTGTRSTAAFATLAYVAKAARAVWGRPSQLKVP